MNADQRYYASRHEHVLVPRGAQAMIGNSYYKLGRGGKPFRWNGEEWVRSALSEAEVKWQARNQRGTFDRIGTA